MAYAFVARMSHLGIVNGQISIISDSVLALINVQKNGVWPGVPLLFEKVGRKTPRN